MVGEDKLGSMETSMKVDSRKVFLKVKESIPGPTEPNMKVIF